MDSYQRYQLEILPVENECYECSDDDRPTLPIEVLEAVDQGNEGVIQDYLSKDGNVNALQEEESLISRACATGKVEIVKLLLQCPDIHLNMKFEGATPLSRAARSGHVECVKTLIDATVACNIQLDGSWKAIAKCLKSKPQLHPRSAAHILRGASSKGHWDVLRLLLDTEYHFVKEDLYPLTLAAVSQNQWDVIYSVFKRHFYGRAQLINEVFAVSVNMRCWEKVEKVLNFMDDDLRFDIDFVKATLSGKFSEVKRLLAEGQYDPPTLNGNLLVSAAGGVEEEAANLLISIKNTYTRRTYSNALFLAALGHCAELVPKLLHNPETSYTLNDLHQANEVLIRLPRYEKREGFLVAYFSDYLKKSEKIL
ncbi:uncharacterized protein [Palaemon carinicauda]|uniref:uncharacterized protein isoform X2 n=1 Tax=Palaemon carinicauda TaxID=392227 RepID=UPI0035B6625B